MALEHDITEMLDALDRARALAREQLGLSPLECRIVRALCSGPQSISELSRHLVANRPSISMAAQRLEQRALVVRDAGPRATLLSLPDEVKRQYEELTIDPMRRALTRWTAAQDGDAELHARDLVRALADVFDESRQDRAVQESTELLHAALRRGDTERASAIAMSLIRDGDTCAAHHALSEALRRVGGEWERGEATVAHERIASSTAERVIEYLRTVVRPSTAAPASGRRAIALTGTGEQHVLPMRIVTSELERIGWQVDLIAGDIPIDDLVDLCTSMAPDAIFVGITLRENVEPTLPLLRRLSAVAPVLVGGQALADAELAAQVEDAGARVCTSVERLASLVVAA